MNSSVMINKMQLRGSTEHKQALLDALDHQHWGEDNQRIIFINQLKLSGYWWELAQKIAQETREISKQSYLLNEYYTSDQLAIFAHYSVFISHSIQCLLMGINPWYLQTWLKQQDLAADPVVLLQHRLFDLPAVIEAIGKANQLDKLFSSLTKNQLDDLVVSLVSICPALMSQNFKEHRSNQSTELSQSAVSWISGIFSKISSVIDLDHKFRLLIQLVSGLAVWKFAPQLMNDNQGFRNWFEAVVQIAQEKTYPSLTLPLAGEGIGLSQLQNKTIESEIARKKKVNDPSFQLGSDSASPLPRGRLGGGEDPQQFFIQQTGLLFLINFFKSLSLTSPYKQEGSGTNPWLLLYQTFEILGQQLQFEIENSLKNLLICISQLTHDEFQAQLSGLQPHKNTLVDTIEQKLRSMNLWRSDWIYLPAKAEVNQAYINIYLDNSSVNLQLRLAGLDVNPGWIPWLGRVIYFHYGFYPELTNRISQGN